LSVKVTLAGEQVEIVLGVNAAVWAFEMVENPKMLRKQNINTCLLYDFKIENGMKSWCK